MDHSGGAGPHLLGARTLRVRSALLVAEHRAISSASFVNRALRTETVRPPNVSSILRSAQ